MANHLTPSELAREAGLERKEVLLKCLENGVPDLQRTHRQEPVHGKHPAGRIAAARSPRQRLSESGWLGGQLSVASSTQSP